MLVAMPPWGQIVELENFTIHDPKFCANEDACAIHNPSHHMRNWPIVIRMDYGWPMVERTCPHGIGHPDPDSLDWYAGVVGEEVVGLGTHGCDGCCQWVEDTVEG